MRKRMRARGSDVQSCVPGEGGQLGPKLGDLFPRVRDISANVGAELDHRLVHLRLDALLQRYLAVIENLLDLRSQLAGLRDRRSEIPPRCQG